MFITLEIGAKGFLERQMHLRIASSELRHVHLHVAAPEERNRTGLYMRRHGGSSIVKVGPNQPLRADEEPDRLPIPDHIKALRDRDVIPWPTVVPAAGGDVFAVEPVMLAVSVSDIVANLMRPAIHRDRLGPYRVFFFEDEPIDQRDYWCACLFDGADGRKRMEMRWVRFDPAGDRALGDDGVDLLSEGLIWAIAVVPLVVAGNPLDAVGIAQRDYDLRQVLGRNAETAIRFAYEAFGDKCWDERVGELVTAHEQSGNPFATFYHSVLALDADGNVIIRQIEGTLPGLAVDLAAEGIVSAGVLDSGGSCAVYDVWLGGYLNHGWYFREPRGAILVFELKSTQRLPQGEAGAWSQRRGGK